MRRTVVASRPEELIDPLVDVLADVPGDPLTPDWIAVPSPVVHRWLSLQLAERLGSVRGRTDGVSANITFARPADLPRIVFEADRARTAPGGSARDGRLDDPWNSETIAWHILATAVDEEDLASDAGAPDDGPTIVWADRIARLLTGYHRSRPAMVRAWAHGRDVGPTGVPLTPGQRWQARLWRAVRARIGHDGPAERIPTILDDLRSGVLDPVLPRRLCFFGVTSFPGGAEAITLLDALAERRDVHVFAALPPSILALPVPASGDDAATVPTRRDERARLHTVGAPAVHPLVEAWGAVDREAALLLGPDLEPVAATAPVPPAGAEPNLLDHLRRAIGAPVAGPADDPPGVVVPNVVFHECAGALRQTEVLRDHIVHLLAADPDLTEEDILVVCPDPDRFIPSIRACFSRRDPADDPDGTDGRPPALRVSTGRTRSRAGNGVADVLTALVTLVTGPAGVAEMLEFCGTDEVARRYGFGDDDLAQLRSWAIDKTVRWGLDAEHRAGFGVPTDHRANSWRFALDSLLTGVVLAGDEVPVFGGVAADRSSGTRADLVGRFADLLAALDRVTADVTTPFTPTACTAVLRTWIDRFVAVDDTRELEDVLGTLHTIDGQARTAGVDALTVAPADLVHLVAARHRRGPSTGHLLRGGIDVAPLRLGTATPHRVVAVLGLDEGALGGDRTDGDDLAALDPRIGDPDPRGTARQALLDTVLAARDHLIVLRNGVDVTKGTDVEKPVVVAELTDAVLAGVPAAEREVLAKTIVRRHPRHAGDPACFIPGGGGPLAGWGVLVDTPEPRPWGTDPNALAAARKRLDGTTDDVDVDWVLAAPDEPTSVSLTELQRFFDKPAKTFLQRTVGLRVADSEDDPEEILPVELNGLTKWKLADELLGALLREAAGDPVDVDDLAEEARRRFGPAGRLPVPGFADATIHTVAAEVAAVFDAVPSTLRGAPTRPVDVAVDVDDVMRVTARFDVVDDPDGGPTVLDATPSRGKPKDRLRAWLQLIVLHRHDPSVDWRVLVVRRDGDGAATQRWRFRPDDPSERAAAALHGLRIATALFGLGRREPLPYYPRLSPALWERPDERVDPNLWHKSFKGEPGDGDDVHVQFLVGGRSLDAVLVDLLADRDRALFASLDFEPDDDRRVPAYAELIWSAIVATTVDADVDADGEGEDPV